MTTKEHNSNEINESDVQNEFWIQNLGNIQNFYDVTIAQDADYKTREFYLDQDVTCKIEKISNGSALTIYIMMRSVLDILFYKYYGSENIVALSPANRNLENSISEDNVVAIVSHLNSSLAFKKYLMYIKKQVLDAYSHQNCDYNQLMYQLSGQEGKTISKMILCCEQLHKLEDIETNGYDFVMNYSYSNASIKVSVQSAGQIYENINLDYFSKHFNQIFRYVIKNLETELSQITFLLDEEKEKLVKKYNQTFMSIPKDKTAVHLLYESARTYKDLIAVQDKNESVSYENFVKRVDQIANHLKKHHIEPGMLVGIMMERNVSLLATIFALWKIGASYIPLDKEYPVERIQFIIEDSSIPYIIISENVTLDAVDDVTLISMEELSEEDANTVQKIEATNDMAAYCIYTSGTTGKPKGVVIEHGNLLNFIFAIREKLSFQEGERILALTTMSFDIFVLEAIVPLMFGMKIAVADDEVTKDLPRLGKFIEETQVSILQMTPSKLKMLLEYDDDGTFLEHIDKMLLGGEELTKNIYDRLHKVYNGRVFNLYGPTETTIWSTVSEIHDGDITIGTPIKNTTIYVLDQDNQLMPEGHVGELCIGGYGVARGYLNRESLTQERYITVSFDKTERVYKTGDLVRWREDGQLEFIGRNDNQIKLRGHRIEIQEIQQVALTHKNVKEAEAVFYEGNQMNPRILLFIVSVEKDSEKELTEYMAGKLPNYMLPSEIIEVPDIPHTFNDKVDKKKLLLQYEQKGREKREIAPSNEVEIRLMEQWEKLLKTDVDVSMDFFEAGGSSLTAILLNAKIQELFQVQLTLEDLFQAGNIHTLANVISSKKKVECACIDALDDKPHFVTFSAQKRLYILSKMDDVGLSYNMPGIMRCEGNINVQKFEDAINQVIAKHQILRTTFHEIGNEIVQKVHSSLQIRLSKIEYQKGIGLETYLADFTRKFDLSKLPLLRVGYYMESEKCMILLFDIHHILVDGFSVDLLIDEIMCAYDGELNNEIRIQYRDYAEFQQKKLASDETLKSQEYWEHKLRDFQTLNLYTDYKRPEIYLYNGDRMDFTLQADVAKKIRRFIYNTKATLNIFFLSIYHIMLSKFSGQSDIVIGLTVTNRLQPDLEKMIGLLINILPIRNDIAYNDDFSSFMGKVKDSFVGAMEHQEYQFEDMIELLDVAKARNRNPVFDAAYIYQDKYGGQNKHQCSDFSMEPIGFQSTTSKYDISLFVNEKDDTFELSFEYNTNLLRLETIEKMAWFFQNMISVILSDESIKIADLNIESEEEIQNIKNRFESTQFPYPKEKNICDLFEDMVKEHGECTAVASKNNEITYEELDRKANRLARFLREDLNIEKGEYVPILLNNSAETIEAILGVIKADAVYVPLDSAVPYERMKYIINDLGARKVISAKKFINTLNKLQWECHYFDTYICMDSFDLYSEEEDKNSLMDLELWNYFGEKAKNQIEGGGWYSSYTGLPFSEEEMEEYKSNTLIKLRPYISKDSKILEIGCSSGLTMFMLAPMVHTYYGVDLSENIIATCNEKIRQNRITNIHTAVMLADQIDKLDVSDFDIVIINSVVQSFSGYNYFNKVLKKAVKKLKDTGIVYVGDIMDFGRKDKLINSLTEFRVNNFGKYHTKTDFSSELFFSKEYFEDLKSDYQEISAIEVTDKIGEISNELLDYRFDVMLHIDKTRVGSKECRKKVKKQFDLSAITKKSDTPLARKAYGKDNVYVLYTSGSTGRPKGVLVNHQGLVNYITWANRTYCGGLGDNMPLYSAITFDLTVTSIFLPLITGKKIVIYNNDNPFDDLLSIFANPDIHLVKLTPSHLRLLNEVDLKQTFIEKIIVGGENLTTQLCKKITHKVSGDLKIYNEYGPTETVVGCMTHTYNEQSDFRDSVPIGIPADNVRLYVLNEKLERVKLYETGELYIAGDGVANGYLNQEQLTSEKFLKNAIKEEAYIYKSGDLVRSLPNGLLEYIGRMDQQVKMNGYRIELGEIESVVRENEIINDAAAVICVDTFGNKSLRLFVTAKEAIEVKDIDQYLKTKLPPYFIPDGIVVLSEMPLNVRGKVNLEYLKQYRLEESETTNLEEINDPISKDIIKMFQNVLAKQGIYHQDDFFELGGHSLQAVTLSSMIKEHFCIEMPLSIVFSLRTVKELSDYVRDQKKVEHIQIQPAKEKEYYDISTQQLRIYLVEQLVNVDVSYHMPYMIRMKGDFHVVQFEKAVNEVIKHHEILRSSIIRVDGVPKQRINPFVYQKLEVEKVDSKLALQRITEFIQKIDLEEYSLMRIKILKHDMNEYSLLFDIHHIICDAISIHLLFEEILYVYEHNKLKHHDIQYKDYVEWSKDKKLASEDNYWIEQLNGELPTLNLPTDRPRSNLPDYNGNSYMFSLEPQIYEQMKQIAHKQGMTPFAFLFTAYNILLHLYTEQNDMIVGVTVSGRNHPGLEDMIGLFINTLPIRSYPRKDKKIIEYALEMRDLLTKSYENQDFKVDEILDKLNFTRDINKNPLFNVVMTYIDYKESFHMKNLEIQPYEKTNQKSKFDITCNIYDYEDTLNIEFEYSTALYNEETMVRMGEHYKNIIGQIIENPEKNMGDLEVVTEVEKNQIIFDFNETDKDFGYQSVVEMFEEQVKLHPNNVAVVCEEELITYGELDKRANTVMSVLRERKIGPSDVVGLMLTRNIDLFVGLYGILKTGAAYVPIDLSAPWDRTKVILEQSQIKIVLANTELDQSYYDKFEVIQMHSINEYQDTIKPCTKVQENDLAYIVFTSGSTGTPKGVMIGHRALSNFVYAMKDKINLKDRTMLCLTTISFDIFVLESLVPLAVGAKVVLANYEQQHSFHLLRETIVSNAVDIMQMTPSRLASMLNEENRDMFSNIETVLVGGESCPQSLLRKLNEYYDKEVFNMYGPSETTVWSTMKRMDFDSMVTIGKPIANTKVFVVNSSMKLQPVGVIGELLIEGAGLSAGYMNQPDLTKQQFIVNPNTKRMAYRTGDYVKWLENGELLYIGRKDNQVKMRGFRIELEEIEQAIIKEVEAKSVCVCIKGEEEKKYIAAYLVMNGTLDVSQLKEALKRRLSSYMVPQYIVQLEEMPLLISGKINYSELPVWENDTEEVNVLELDEMEGKIYDIWSEVLGHNRIGKKDNFFDVGGNSLLLIKLYDRIKEMFPVDIKTIELFQTPNIEKTATLIREKQNSSKQSQEVRYNRFADDYFEHVVGEFKERFYEFELDGEEFRKLSNYTQQNSLRFGDVLSGLFVYLLSQYSIDTVISVHFMENNSSTAKQMIFDMETYDTFQELFMEVSKREDKPVEIDSKAMPSAYSMGENDLSLSLFYIGEEENTSYDLTDIYDIICKMKKKADRNIIRMEFNGRMKKEQQMEMVKLYNNIIKTFIADEL